MKAKVAPGPTALTMAHEVFPGDTNTYGTLFGGQMVALMDRCAGMCASRFAKMNFVTVAIDSLFFSRPVKLGQVIELNARVVFTSGHSVAVKVEVLAGSKLDWDLKMACSGMFFFVAKDPKDRTVTIPQLKVATPVERRDWHEAEAVRAELLTKFKK